MLPRSKLALALLLLATAPVAAQSSHSTIVYDAPLRVCADPDDMPYSDKAGNGFENKLAQMVAGALGTSVTYTWYPDGPGFLRQTLDAMECDVVMGVPALDGIDTTRSYYRSGYVFVSRADSNLDFTSMSAPELRNLRIGVALIGADGTGTPPAVALGRQGITNNIVGFPVYGSGATPQADPVRAVARGEIDLAAMWGPIAGYYAKDVDVPLRLEPITDTETFLPQLFQYPIAMGVRLGDDDLKLRLNAFIAAHRSDIDELLRSYGVPLL